VYYFEGKVLEVATRWICTFGLHSRRWKEKKTTIWDSYLWRGEGNLWCNLEEMMVTMITTIMAVMVAVMKLKRASEK